MKTKANTSSAKTNKQMQKTVNKTVNTDIEKSHSVWSNTKLTFISFLAACGFSGLFVFLGIKETVSDAVFYTGMAICAALTVLTAFLFGRFKR